MIDLGTSIKEIHFRCSYCDNKGEAIEVHNKGGVNDKGGFILECNHCSSEFFIEMENPSNSNESRIISHNFKVVKIIDFAFEDDKQLIRDRYQEKPARDIIEINGQMPLLKGAWKLKPKFRINSSDEIFTCPKCNSNVESESYKDIQANNELINSEYKGWLNWYLNDKCNPQMITITSSTKCSNCDSKFDYTAFTKFNGRGELYIKDNFYLADINESKPNINGVYTRAQSKRFLEKLVLRWNLIACQIIVVSPFIGFDKKLAIKSPDKFQNLLEWFLTLNSFDKTKVLIRKSEYGKIKEVIGKDIFDMLNNYGLLNNIIEEMRSSTPHFHAKFYAGIIPDGENSYVEILTGSYNLHEESPSMENLIFITMSLKEFEKKYLTPLKIGNTIGSYKVGFEILKINNEGKLIFPKKCDDILK